MPTEQTTRHREQYEADLAGEAEREQRVIAAAVGRTEWFQAGPALLAHVRALIEASAR